MNTKINAKYKEDQEDVMRGISVIYDGYKELLLILRDKVTLQKPRPFELCHHTVSEISSRVHKDKARFSYFHDGIDLADEFKVGGYFAYWIAKLRPVYYTDGNKSLYPAETWLNQYLALFVGVTRANQKNSIAKIDPKLIHEMAYTLKYRVNSGDDLALFFRLMDSNMPGELQKTPIIK